MDTYLKYLPASLHFLRADDNHVRTQIFVHTYTPKNITNGNFPYRLTKMAKNAFDNYRIFTLENRIEIWIAFPAVKKSPTVKQSSQF